VRVIITGAAGRIGTQAVEELSRTHELCLIDRTPVATSKNSIVADLADDRAGGIWMESFKGADVVIHLAADIRPDAAWNSVVHNNVQATWNVTEAAANHGVSRVIFASSNWAVKALENKLAPACYLPDGPKIGSDAPPWPKTAYGLSKAFGELTGRMFVDEGRLDSFIAVRIGNYNPTPPKDEHLRTRWIGVDDMQSLLRRCVEAPFKGFHVVYGVSAQSEVPYDLSYTRSLLFWEPKQHL
jgi:nucleoside-diphosphate-sugar epimerase